jgi:hypothetical protein
MKEIPKKSGQLLPGKKTAKALNLKTSGMHLVWTIAIATPLKASIPAEMGARICSSVE